MAALRGLLVALLPGGLCIYDHSPLIQGTGSLIKNTAPRQVAATNPKSSNAMRLDWSCEHSGNLCVPADMCGKEHMIITGTKIHCPPTWQCCTFEPVEFKELERLDSYKRKRRLANWNWGRMAAKAREQTFMDNVEKKWCSTGFDWEWFLGGCGHVSKDDKEYERCQLCKTTVEGECNEHNEMIKKFTGINQPENTLLEVPYSYSLVDEICQIAKSENECPNFYGKKRNAQNSVGSHCEITCHYDDKSCGGKGPFGGGVEDVKSVIECKNCEDDPGCKSKQFLHLLNRLPKTKDRCEHHFCRNVCRAKCNRCLQDNSRHLCLHDGGECSMDEPGCKHLCGIIKDVNRPDLDKDVNHRNLDVVGKTIDLMNTYTTKPWSFSEWVIEYITTMVFSFDKETLSHFERDGQTCRIYYDEGDDVSDVKAIALMREPVNIQMNKWGFSQLRMMRNFGGDKHFKWAGSKYDDHVKVDKDELPPNIAIGCDTPVVPSGNYGYKKDLNPHEHGRRNVHILSVIWPVFDSKSSPDFAYFFNEATGEVEGEKLRKFYEKVLLKIVAAADEMTAPSIYMDGFGLDKALEVKTRGLDVMRHEFTNALMSVTADIQISVKFFLPPDFEFVFKDDRCANEKSIMDTKPFDFADPKEFMNSITRRLKEGNKRILYVSSWDAYSFIGSGNAYDDSMNGQVGRATALAVLGWPHTNRKIKLKKVSKTGEAEGAIDFYE